MTKSALSPVQTLLGANLDSRLEVFGLVERGIPLTSVHRLLSDLQLLKEEHVLLSVIGISRRTLNRRLRTNPECLLSPQKSGVILRFAEVLELAEHVFGQRQVAIKWMGEPCFLLGGLIPIEMLHNPMGYELVSEHLTRLEYGIF